MHNNNAGTLRYLAALMVLWGHGFPLTGGSHAAIDPISAWLLPFSPFHRPVHGLGVMFFFALSGYLISASFMKNGRIVEFLVARGLRIYPGVIGAVLVCACLIGPVFTTLPLMEYLQHPDTWSFVKHNSVLVNGIAFRLPGVFETAPMMDVNGPLWTLPIELEMYVYVLFAGLLGLLQSRAVFNGCALVLVVVFAASPENFKLLQTPDHAYMAASFLAGVFFQLNKDILTRYLLPFIMAFLCAAVITYGKPLYDLVALILMAALLLSVAFHCRYRLPALDKYGDLSYGLYLYAFPIQQMLIVTMTESNPLLVNAIATLLATSAAHLSWHAIEKPAMTLKRPLLSLLYRREGNADSVNREPQATVITPAPERA